MRLSGRFLPTLLLLAGPTPRLQDRAPTPPTYWAYVAAESDDQVARVRLGPEGLVLEKTIDVGFRPTDIEGPHGLRVAPEGDYWYVSLAHGNPFGSVVKYRTGSDEPVASVQVGMFPATLDLAASSGLLYVVNFDLHGDMTPSSISVVDAGRLVEVARVPVGVMPHGARLDRAGDLLYSVSMMTDELVEVDAFAFQVRRRLALSENAGLADRGGDAAGTARPTWAQPDPFDRFLYVACNGIAQIKEVDLESWTVSRTFDTPAGPYNIAVSPDGRLLIVTYRTAGSTGIWDIEDGKEIARIENSVPLPHGVVVTPDSRYALVSVEGVGGDRGVVDAIDLDSLRLVSTVRVGRQASGIALWKSE